jgi:hypothetical protein|tara:strand:+ start:833 stop:940 length:108 start_codon:yes stop_codon:yes gene_type:complete
MYKTKMEELEEISMKLEKNHKFTQDYYKEEYEKLG